MTPSSLGCHAQLHSTLVAVRSIHPCVWSFMAETSVHVHGAAIDEQTRCVHWHSPRDVVAIKMHCCQLFYPCHSCHQQQTDTLPHPHTVWPRDKWHHPALLCGVCKSLIAIDEYLSVYETSASSAVDPRCPRCAAAWNPGCGKHHVCWCACHPSELLCFIGQSQTIKQMTSLSIASVD